MSFEDGRICDNQPYGQHIQVRCRDCGATYSTKNIGGMGADGAVQVDRSLFATTGREVNTADMAHMGLSSDHPRPRCFGDRNHPFGKLTHICTEDDPVVEAPT